MWTHWSKHQSKHHSFIPPHLPCLIPWSKVRNWPEKIHTLILMMSGAKTSLIWLHADPPFPFIWNRRNAQQFGILEGKADCILIQNKLLDYQFHISGNFVHSRVVSHCTMHYVLTQTNFCLISFFNSKTSVLHFPDIDPNLEMLATINCCRKTFHVYAFVGL